MSAWLENMGYQTEYNKNFILERLHQNILENRIQDLLHFYETLGKNVIDE
jgi:hypothetical protein